MWPLALLALVRRNRRRYGGYIAHLGFAVMLIGIAASSSFQHSRNVTMRPGQSIANDGYVFHYVRPTESATPERISFGALIDVTKGGRQVGRIRTMQSFYPSNNPADGFIGRFFESANTDSTIGLRTGALSDIWTFAAANLDPLAPLITRGDRLFTERYNAIVDQVRKLPVSEQQLALNQALGRIDFWQARDLAVQGIAAQYLKHGYRVQFLLIVFPLVGWLWAGAAIIFLGGLISLLPPPMLARRRSPVAERPRVAVQHELA
jgi:cytochrome c-type biogenesis protein CcmF